MSEEPKPQTRWGRWVGGIAAVVVMAAVMIYAVNDQSLRGGVAGLERELDKTDPGWRHSEIRGARPAIPAADNSLTYVMTVAGALPAGWPDAAEMKKLEGLPPNAALGAAERAALTGLLAPVPRQPARDLIKYRHGQFDVPGGIDVMWTPTPKADRLFTVMRALVLDSLDLAEAGRTDDALDSVRTILSVARSFEGDTSSVGQWAWVTIPSIGAPAVEQALALGEPSDAALAKLADAIVAPSVTQAVRTHRAMHHEVLAAISRGDIDGLEVMRAFGLKTPTLFGYGGPIVRREMVRREHAQLLRLMTRVVELSKQPPSKQFTEDDAIETEFMTAWGTFTKLSGALLRGVNGQGRRLAASAAALRGLIAVERYRLKHKKWPARLDDVVPDFLDKVPADPIDDAPLRYKRTADGVVVYSIGNDRKDDGGDVGEGKPDVGYRLWDAGKRRVKP